MGQDRDLKLLEAADWKDITLRLTYYAYWKASKYTWKSRNPGQLPKGKTPEDVVCEAIEKVLSGVRNWNPDKYPNLFIHLKKIIDSDLHHLVNSAEHKKSIRIPEEYHEMSIESDHEEMHSEKTSTASVSAMMENPEELIITQEDEKFVEQVKNEFYAMVKGDDDLEMLLICFEEGIDKPEEIAEQTGWDIKKVYNQKRKLFRKAAKFNEIIRNIRRKMEA